MEHFAKDKTFTLLSLILLFSLILPALTPKSVSAAFVSATETAYASEFLSKCDGQNWFIEEIERQLNIQEKSINKLNSANDLDLVVTLGFTNKSIKGKIPRVIGEFKKLKYLYMANNQLSGGIPSELFLCTELRAADFSQNSLTGGISPSFGTLSKLETLSLWGNSLTGSIPKELGNVSSLRNLDLSRNNLSGSIPVELTNLPNLTLLSLSQNRLSGEIPSAIGNLTNLKVLLLWNNQLTGNLPTSIVNLAKIEIMDISQNRLAGNLFPAGFGSLSTMIRFSAYKNVFTGEMPANTGNLSAIEIFDIAGNKITGEIPPSIGNLVNLKEFKIHDNQIRGVIPDAFANMPNLKKVYFDNNKLSGYIPGSLYAKNRTADINAASNYLTGANLSGISKKGDNFSDGTTNSQNVMVMPQYLKVDENVPVNAYTIFVTANAQSRSANTKAKLNPDDYICRMVSPTPAEAAKIDLQITPAGFFITALVEIPYAEAILFEILIKENDGSGYSTARFKVNTEKAVAAPVTPAPQPGVGGFGGGGGGGGIFPPEIPEDEIIEVMKYQDDEPDGVASASHRAYITGYTDGSVKPSGMITQEETAFMLFGVIDNSDKDTFEISELPYTDIDSSRWSAKAIAYLSKKSIMQGYADGTFRPSAPITRAEFARLISVYKKLTKEADNPFTDIDTSWAKSDILKIYVTGYITGYADGTYKPDRNITRAETVVSINKMLDRKPDAEMIAQKYGQIFTDLNTAHWAYAQIMEAAISHGYERAAEGAEKWTD